MFVKHYAPNYIYACPWLKKNQKEMLVQIYSVIRKNLLKS